MAPVHGSYEKIPKVGPIVLSTIAEGGGIIKTDESSTECSSETDSSPTECCIAEIEPKSKDPMIPKSGKMQPRQEWNKEVEFVLACVGNAVGLGNLWRFPYLCHDSGGGAFLIPYFLMLIVCGIPLLYMELAVGQYTRLGPVGALKTLCPLFQGAGMGMVMLSFLLCTYYNVILSWAIYYMFSVFRKPLPWAECLSDWNEPKCWDDYSENASFSRPNDTISPSQLFYELS